MKKNNRMYLTSVFAVFAAAVVGFLQLASFSSVSARRTSKDVTHAVPEMLAYALTHETANLAHHFSIMNQLPCESLDGAALGGKTLVAGVYCAAAANVGGELTFDASGDTAAIFVLRVSGALTAEAGSKINLINGAQAANVHFVVDSASIGANTEFRGSILANNQISIASGAAIKGRVQSVNQSEQARESDAPQGAGTGTLEICKSLDPSSVDISNRVFTFTVTGVVGTVGTAANPIRVPAGACSSAVEVLAGVQTITELNSGTFTNQAGAFAGGFQMNRVETITTNSPSTLGAVNRATRQATINIVEGTPQQELTLRFVNQFAITGFVEICKRAALVPMADGTGFTNAADPDVTGFFTFTVENVFTQNQQNPNVRTLQQFVVPVGFCTNAIAVTISNPAPFGQPRESTVRVTELGRAGAFLESVTTIPADRKIGEATLNSGVDSAGSTFANPSGGYATVRVIEGGSPANETLINFFNRSNQGFVKICKIAGPGIPLNTPFNFRITGLTQTAIQPAQFAEVTRTVTVLAGPADQGSCQLVPDADGGIQKFIIGTRVLAVETGPLTIDGFQVRTSRIRSSTGVFTPVEFPNGNPNPDLEPTANRISRAAIIARSEVIAFEFANFLFRPTTLKICKIAGSPSLLNQPFTFDVALVSPTGAGGDLFPAASASLTVAAGAADGGNCAVVNGANFLGGALNAGSTVTITERAASGSDLTAVSSSTSPTSPTNGISANLANRTATLTGANGLRADVTINIATFTNTSVIPPATLAKPFDFDGDGKSDLSTFNADGVWKIRNSAGGITDTRFGISTDRTVPADFDGDGKADIAVYRDGNWYMLRSGSGNSFYGTTFGQAGDVPQPADFDGDNKADVAVFRPSNGAWYWMGSTSGFGGMAFGQIGDKPAVGDYDGDGRADQAVFRPSTGAWYMNRSTAGFTGINWGNSSDRPVAADYDGDGKTDVAVFRSAEGMWYINGSTAGFSGVNWGNANDRLVPADYNGDGKTDIAVYRDGTWYIREDASFRAVVFGNGNEAPVPASFLQ